MAKRDIIRAAKRAGVVVTKADYYWTPTPGEMVPQWEVEYQPAGDYEPETEFFESTTHAVKFFESLATQPERDGRGNGR